MAKGNPRGWRDVNRRLIRRHQLLPELAATPDLSRGETRFAAEVLLAAVEGDELPEAVMSRALFIAGVMARG